MLAGLSASTLTVSGYTTKKPLLLDQMPQKIKSKSDQLSYIQETLFKAGASITAIENGEDFEELQKKVYKLRSLGFKRLLLVTMYGQWILQIL